MSKLLERNIWGIYIPENCDMALKRMKRTQKRLLKNETITKEYNNAIKGYVKKDYVKF